MVMQGVQALTQQVLRLYGIGIAIILGEPCNTVSTEPTVLLICGVLSSD